MLFEKFIEQHCVHRVVADAVRLAFFVAYHQVTIYLFHVFGYESELRYTRSVNLLFVTKGNRLKGQNRFAGFGHRFDFSLEPPRGTKGAKMVGRIHHHFQTGDRYSINGGDESGALLSVITDADRVGLTSKTFVANIDIVIARGKILAS